MYPKWPTRTVTQLFFSLWFRIKYANDLNKYFLHERRRNLNFLPLSFFIRSSRPEVFCKKSFLKSFVKLSVENQCQTRSFSVNFAKFSRTPPVIAFPILKPLDSQRQWCKWMSELLTILFISAFLVVVGIFAFIFRKHKLSASRRLH